MNLKREIDKTIGLTKEHEENVWRKLQQPKRKNRLPLFIALAATVIACLVLAINFLPANTANTLESPNEKTSDGYPFTVIRDQDKGSGSTINFHQQYIVLTAANQQELDHWLQYFDIELPSVSFDDHFVMITQFSSDGCGRIIDKIDTSNNQFIIKLARPLELRNKKELFCTAQLMTNIQVLQVKKFAGYDKLTQADFIGGGTVNINELKINDQYYNFGLISDYVQVEKVTVNDIQASKQYTIEDEESLQLLSNSIFRSTQLPGIFNMTTSNYKLIVHHENGEQLMLHIFVDKEKNKLLFVSEKNTSQVFELTGEYAKKLLARLQL